MCEMTCSETSVMTTQKPVMIKKLSNKASSVIWGKNSENDIDACCWYSLVDLVGQLCTCVSLIAGIPALFSDSSQHKHSHESAGYCGPHCILSILRIQVSSADLHVHTY